MQHYKEELATDPIVGYQLTALCNVSHYVAGVGEGQRGFDPGILDISNDNLMICVVNQQGEAVLEQLWPENNFAIVIFWQVDSVDHGPSEMVLDHQHLARGKNGNVGFVKLSEV